MKERASGILLPVFSLPSPYGIGTLGEPARRFVDFLERAGQRWWQILPLGPVGAGNSPYMSPSAFAGNPLLLDVDELFQAGLLTRAELETAKLPGQIDRIDYARLREVKLPLLVKAWKRAAAEPKRPWGSWEKKPHAEPDWLAPWCRWAAEHALYGEDDPDFYYFLEEQFACQWYNLKTYANERGVGILGDVPIYVSPSGADAAQHPQLFQTDETGAFSSVAGVPPDYFSADGQLWGNPLYDWKGHKKDLFEWWSKRVRHCAALYDGLRIDHFRGLDRYWSVPADAETAKEGCWEEGPGLALVDALKQAAGEMELVAEDLGVLDDRAVQFFADSGLPGMSVLVYAFSPDGENAYLPHNCPKNKVIYTTTHDCPTFLQWLEEEAGPEEKQFALDYLDLRLEDGLTWGALRGAWGSPCVLAVATLQDVLGLGADARTNLPGTSGPDNWSWRVREEALNDGVAQRLRRLTKTFGRLRPVPPKAEEMEEEA